MKPHLDVRPKVSLNLLLETDVSLLAASCAEIEHELEKQKKNPCITLITRRHPRWFYWDQPKQLEIPAEENEIKNLIDQARFELDGKDFEIAQELIYSVDHRGYLKTSIKEIADALSVNPERVEKVRKFIAKELEPIGVCCIDLQDLPKALQPPQKRYKSHKRGKGGSKDKGNTFKSETFTSEW